MKEKNYLQWLAEETETKWWHDSAIPDEIEAALAIGALGVTTNPVLTYRTLQLRQEYWKSMIKDIAEDQEPDLRAESFLKKVACHVAEMLKPIYKKSGGKDGYACGQLDPTKAGDSEAMLAMAKRIHEWGPNIAIKLPSTQAGLEVIEEISSLGYAVCATINFSVAQAIAVAESYKKGSERAKKAGIKPGTCFAVQQVGRLDDYLRDIAKDKKVTITEEDIRQSGNVVAKRAYEIFKQRGYETRIMPAGLRGSYHLTPFAGAEMTFSIHPMIQKIILEENLPKEKCIDKPADKKVVEKLLKIPDFVRAYEPDGLKKDEFITFGVAQRTLTQFVETGWYPLQSYGFKDAQPRWK
jgi:transaldolase